MRYHIHILTQCSLFGKVIKDVQLQVLQTRLHLEEYEIFGVHNDDVEESEVEDSEERELSQSRKGFCFKDDPTTHSSHSCTWCKVG